MTPVRIGLLGLGTVGGGTLELLARNGDEIARQTKNHCENDRHLLHDAPPPVKNSDG